MSTEKEEVYDKDLGIRSPGRYTVQYSDASVSREIVLDDQMETSWLKAAPVPFQNELAVQLESPETGKISVRLVDALGNILQRKELNVEKNKFYNIQFDHAGALHSGTYYVQFKGLEENRTIKIVK
jgi:hypothetical protein